MKILFDHHLPFSMAHGGAQIQIEQTKAALEKTGVEVEFLRWWDGGQRGDAVHFFAAPSAGYVEYAHTIHLPVLITQLFTETCNRTDAQLRRQGLFVRAALALPFGRGIKQQLAWNAYRQCEQNVVGLEAERRVLETVYDVPPEKISVIPLGLSENYLHAGAGTRSETHLICTGTITPRKNSVELAEMARAAKVPILFVGKPYSEADAYWARFKSLIDNQFVKYHPFVSEEPGMIQLLQRARGFVLMSWHENWCLSAHEAIACGLPVLVQDQKWSKERFGGQARYFEEIGFSEGNVQALRKFWEEAPSLSAPNIRLFSWIETAERLQAVYERVLSTSR
jgi:glycosyltransferase involved in cell wall biosynthesis